MINSSQILDFIKTSDKPVTKREIARAFNIKGGENRVVFKQILRVLEKDGAVTKHAGGAYGVPKGLPSAGIIEVTQITIDGDILARPVDWNEKTNGPAPVIEIAPDKKHYPRLKEGSRALARFARLDQNLYEARLIKALDTEKGRVLGMVRVHKNGAILQPVDKKAKFDFDISSGDLNGAKDGDLALGEIQPERGIRNKKVRIVSVIGRRDDPKAISVISLYEAGLTEDWPDAVLKECKGMKVPPLGKREDLRSIPLVTIDGADARDFDDAVFAEPTNDGGFHIIVAIADVSYYVRPGSALDIEAKRRGNSTYFPDRVVPMLPEALSNDLCSLRPDEDRAAMAAHLWIDAQGQLKKYKFTRALIRSHARLIYDDVQAAYDEGDKGLKPVLTPLYAAYKILDKAREKRGALDLDLPERQIIIDENGDMTGVKKRQRLDAHKLIEEFMILANVAAAKALEDKKDAKLYPCVYRVHDAPSLDKLDSARSFVESFGLSMPRGQVMKPAQLNQILQKAAKLEYSPLISQVILRTQSQAVYAIENIGHYGLALSKYAHFTSPIRRYADLLVHRSLTSAYAMGPGGLSDEERATMAEIAQHISSTERTSMEAERSATDRFTAAYLSGHIGAEFDGRINGVARFGLFVTLDESGADGLVPMKTLDDDFYVHDEESHALVGRRKGKIYRLGAKVRVKLKEADGLTGSTVLQLVGHHKGADIEGASFKRPRIGGGPKRGKGKPSKSGKKPSFRKKHKR